LYISFKVCKKITLFPYFSSGIDTLAGILKEMREAGVKPDNIMALSLLKKVGNEKTIRELNNVYTVNKMTQNIL
jgi:hypothetical protein